MKVALHVRNRALLGYAVNKYEKLAKGTKANLTTLNLATMQVQTALGCCAEIKTRMASAYEQGEAEGEEPQSIPNTLEIEFTSDLVTLVHDALDFVLGKYAKLEETQLEMLTGTSETEETQNEVRALKNLFMTQLELAGGSLG